MYSKGIEFRVGLIILIGMIILSGSLYWLQGYKLERNAQIIKVRFNDVGTLAVGDRVTVSGVRRGKVGDFILTSEGVEVKLLLYDDVILKHDARFVIKNMGLMGERFIAIYPGNDSIPFDKGEVAEGQYDTGLPEVMGLMGEMVSELRDLVFAFRQHVGSDSTLVSLNRTVANLEKVSKSMADYLSRNEEQADKTVENFYNASKSLNRLLDDNRSRVDSSMRRFDNFSIKLEKVVNQLDTLSISARQFADRINSSDGTLQLLIEDRRLYDDLRGTADNIDDLINDIRANPRKYINLTLEIF
ncbi:MAG: MlaD family protein [candidate division Zixibacteria bacterium]|nr:MlaD family protein [candidate division Zixibacteria bacterium]